MRIGAVLGLVLAAISISPTQAQNENKIRTRDLKLHIMASDVQNGVPGKLTLALINTSNHAMVVPIPTTECGDQFRGNISFQLDFTPAHPSGDSEGHGHGCGEGVSDWPLILDRIKEWKTLRPGDSILVETTAKNWLFDFDSPGRYRVWAEYDPPELSQHDQAALRQSGINFPHRKLASNHLTFIKRR